MKLCLINHNFKYELEKLIRIFLPFEKIEFSKEICKENSAVTELSVLENEAALKSTLYIGGKIFSDEEKLQGCADNYDSECERLLAVTLFNCFKKASGLKPEWGILTGVRPAKLYSRLTDSFGEEKARAWFREALFVSENKISLCAETVLPEKRITQLSRSDSFSLYVSIPFCPTRCAYCSFVSHSVENAGKLVPKYISLLKEELIYTAELAKKLNLRLETVYIGGGTPTSLTAEQLEQVLSTIENCFDLSKLREYTVEAGRPDTVTEEKLNVIKKYGVGRISINPQTMNDSVLQAIGRRHTAKETVDAFLLARKCGFDNINTDLIAGLPHDTPESFEDTLSSVLALDPESITVHSLSMKRSSNLTIAGAFPEKKSGEDAARMVEYARKALKTAGYYPYYMYRQSKTVGNLENVGYAKKGAECLYNVYTMDETHTVLACGASAVSKLREPNGAYIERIFNFKYPYEYISRFDEICARKDATVGFYKKYPF